jgi:hypothetical protein
VCHQTVDSSSCSSLHFSLILVLQSYLLYVYFIPLILNVEQGRPCCERAGMERRRLLAVVFALRESADLEAERSLAFPLGKRRYILHTTRKITKSVGGLAVRSTGDALERMGPVVQFPELLRKGPRSMRCGGWASRSIFVAWREIRFAGWDVQIH